uniref:DNA polymerase n=1 Tax=viral metagenome TaxID=1070528 RepID=A0A6C0ER73_9ZZZZ
MPVIQPADWIENDINFKYTVDVFGRTDKGEVAQVRLTGFRPYFYLRMVDGENSTQVQGSLEQASGKQLRGIKITLESKLDAMRGFSGLKPIKVWKLSFPAIWMFKTVQKTLKSSMRIGTRKIMTEDIFEANLPPFIRLFHEMDLSPASPFEFEADDYDADDDVNVDVFYEVNYDDIKSASSQNIPLLVAAYDIETYSDSGNFPVASNPTDEIIQIGISFRYSNDLLTNIKRFVFVSGTCSASQDSSVIFVPCRNEKDLLDQFQRCIQKENPDVMCGYNTFGFDDGYIADRASRCGLQMKFGRIEGYNWKHECAKTEKKTFELASGKFAVRYLEMPGRLPIDLMLSVRREQNLDSYKLDNVSNVFLRDKVSKIITNGTLCEIHTKNTRGLFVGNLVRFDVVANSSNPYHDGAKFKVLEVYPKKFVIELNEYNFQDLSEENIKKLEWSVGKDDIDVKYMFASHKGSADDRAVVAKYCIQDCDLVLTLMAKLDTLVNARGMADVCRVPIQYIFLRGQGIKIFSAVVYNASKRNQIIMTQESLDGDASYEGAIVLPPKIGMYLDQPIAVLDFNSLYPSNMIAYNLSPDTLVYVKTYDSKGKRNPDEVDNGEDLKAAGYTIDEIGYDTYDDNKNPTGRTVCGFAQPTSDVRTIGVLPLTLDILLKKRKETRKIMESIEDEAQKAVLNGLQLAYKVVANSVYGQCGSRTSPIRKMEVAACTTAVGRQKIYDAKAIVVNEFGAEVIYGDSVASYTPLMLRINGVQVIMSPEELGSLGIWNTCDDRDKEYCELKNVESWTEDGWTTVERIIRHILASHKKMIRVLTHTGLVDVTDDHSLLLPDGKEASSKNLVIGDSLLHHDFPKQDIIYESNDVNKARIAGFFVGDGSCGVYDCPSGIKSSWALNNSNIDLLTHYLELCKISHPHLDWVINNTLVSSGVYKLVPVSNNYGDLKKFIEEYRKLYYVNDRKNIPDWIMNGSIEIQKAFWDGFYDADGDKDMNGYVRFDQKNQTTSAQLAFIASKLGYNISMNTRTDKPLITRITCNKSTYRRNPITIKKMHEIEYSGFVYDLTTKNHHFQAGVGKMIVHNTDSIFIKFPTKDLAESIKLGQQSAARITSLCRKAHKIEYEKTMFPFILFCRKRYVGMLYETDITKCYRKTMGVALKRRDNAPIVKDIFGGALDILMEKRDIRPAQEFVKEMLVKLIKNEFPLEKFIITKQLRDDYKNPGQIAHRVLADRMEERDAGNAPQVGDRLPYIYVSNRKDEKKQGDKIEHVDYVKEKSLKPDTEFYISNQIQNPVAQLFALAIDKLDGYKSRLNYDQMLKDFMEDGLDEEDATLKVLDKKEKELDSILFLTAPYLTKHKRGPMDMFIRR